MISRADNTDHGRALPVHLTAAGQQRRHAARSAVYAIEECVIKSIPARRLTALLADRDTMTRDPPRMTA